MTRERTVYTLTDKGREALRHWIGEPSRFPRIQNEALARLVAGYLVDDHVLAGSFRALRADLDRVRDGLTDAERFAATLPERQRYLNLVHNLGRRIVDTLDEWLDDVDREFAADPRSTR